MILENCYPVITSPKHLSYAFFSKGPKGIIRKVVRFQEFESNIFNLAFGDWNEQHQQIDDFARSNNQDYDKVLATVAFVIKDFISFNPDATIVMRGSTTSRTRLYQMGIQANLDDINKLFVIKGFENDGWQDFKKGRNYEAFLLKARKE
jgi:hypothetical protein